jgi:hypothetical protein
MVYVCDVCWGSGSFMTMSSFSCAGGNLDWWFGSVEVADACRVRGFLLQREL